MFFEKTIQNVNNNIIFCKNMNILCSNKFLSSSVSKVSSHFTSRRPPEAGDRVLGYKGGRSADRRNGGRSDGRSVGRTAAGLASLALARSDGRRRGSLRSPWLGHMDGRRSKSPKSSQKFPNLPKSKIILSMPTNFPKSYLVCGRPRSVRNHI